MRIDTGKNPYDELDRFDEDDLLVDDAPTQAPSPVTAPQTTPDQPLTPAPTPSRWKKLSWPWVKKSEPESAKTPVLGPSGEPGQYIVSPADGSMIFVPTPPLADFPAWWKQQPYYAIAHMATVGGTLAIAWLFGILAAQILPGNISQPPIQETALRKSSRLASRLWNVRQLWHAPTAETRIEAIPLPNIEPVIEAAKLSPIERQPLIDELNAIETEILTLDRRMETLEKQLGRPPYQGADIDSRVNSLRAAIDPPVRSAAEPSYKPTPTNPNDTLLDVARLKITLPSDALFTPGQSDLKENPLLNQVLNQLINYPKSTIIIRSYSDDQAKAQNSRDYTLAQANVLGDYLQASLPEGYRWVVLGGGRSQPAASNENELGRQKNRRIEILVDTR